MWVLRLELLGLVRVIRVVRFLVVYASGLLALLGTTVLSKGKKIGSLWGSDKQTNSKSRNQDYRIYGQTRN